MMNPVLRGWIGYYGRFRPSALVSVLRTVNPALRMWGMHKYKRFKHRPQAAMAWLCRISLKEPGFFVHWELTGLLPYDGG
jgi:RNA-directed DNA polymerase